MTTLLSYAGSLEARVTGAAMAAAVLTLRLPTRELRGAVAAFLTDELEWKSMVVAARYGQLTLLRLLHESPSDDIVSADDAMAMAAGAGHLHIVQWLHVHSREGCSTRAMDSAAGNGHLQIVQWLHTNRTEGCTTLAMDSAAANGHIAVQEWLSVHRSDGASTCAVQDAAINGRVDVVAWLWRHQPELFDSMTVKSAVQGAVLRGRLPVLQWFAAELQLHALTIEDLTTLSTLAQAAGNVEVVNWIRRKQEKQGGQAASSLWRPWLQQIWSQLI